MKRPLRVQTDSGTPEDDLITAQPASDHVAGL